MVGIEYTRLYTGTLGNVANVVVYTATEGIAIVSIVFTNTDAAAATVNLKIDPADGGNDKFLIKSISLEPGYTLTFDGQRFSLINTAGNLVTTGAVSDLVYGIGWNGVTDIAASKNAIYDQMELRAPKASPTFTGVVTAPTIDLTGGQIAFPAAAVPSADPNTLDDYEEGTWTPDLKFGEASVDITYSANNGAGYVKIGTSISITCQLLLTNKGTSNGTAKIYGLPFTIKNTQGYQGGVGIGATQAITFADMITLYFEIGQVFMVLYETTNGGVLTQITDADFANTSLLGFSGIYVSS